MIFPLRHFARDSFIRSHLSDADINIIKPQRVIQAAIWRTINAEIKCVVARGHGHIQHLGGWNLKQEGLSTKIYPFFPTGWIHI